MSEFDPPDGESSIEWILLTSLPVSTEEEIKTVIEYDKTRWMIEIYFCTLKSGCRVEERRFETIERMLCCLAVFMIAAWRTL
jgi:hypothetical protein